MIDQDFAAMYAVETKQLKRQVKRNIEGFPKDFMFELTKEEFENLRSQIGISVPGVYEISTGNKINNTNKFFG